MKKNNNKT